MKMIIAFAAGMLIAVAAQAETARTVGATGPCAHELLAYCGNVVIGQGRQRVCLKQHASQASEQCKAKIAEWFGAQRPLPAVAAPAVEPPPIIEPLPIIAPADLTPPAPLVLPPVVAAKLATPPITLPAKPIITAHKSFPVLADAQTIILGAFIFGALLIVLLGYVRRRSPTPQ